MFRISGRDTTPPLEVQKRVFNKVAQPIERGVIFPFHFAVFLRRDNYRHALFDSLLNEGISIIRFIGQQGFGAESLDQCSGLLTIRSGTLCNTYSDRHTMRIHGQMYLGVKPPLVRLIVWLPPRAPAAWGCTLT